MNNIFCETAKRTKFLYELACEDYLKLFCEKHGYDYEQDAWVGREVGGVACINDYFIDMSTIRTDIDLDVQEGEFLEWYDYCIKASEYGITTPNFSSWVKGCPRTSEAKFEELDELKRQLIFLIEKEQEVLTSVKVDNKF